MANEAAQTFLNGAAKQAKGIDAIDTQTYTDLIHEAGDWSWAEKEQFLGKLSAQYVDTMYTDAAWTDKYSDLYFQNEEQFASVVQIINTEMPEVRENRAWSQITSGTTTIGSNVVYLPVVNEQLTGGTSSWAVPYALTGTQLNTAFKDASGLKRFESYVKLSADNSVRYHLARMSAANRNNYMIEKLAKGNSAGKVNVVNLVEEYCRMTGRASMSAISFLNNTDGCLRMVNRIFKKYKMFVSDMTTLFSMQDDTNGKFIPDDRFTFNIIGDFASLLESEVYSNTFHDNFVTLKGYREIPSWQAIRSNSTTLTFSDLTAINAENAKSIIDSSGVEYAGTGIIGMMCDKWAIMHTIVRHRTGIQRDDIKDITLIEHQFTDRYINNLMLNGVVFTVQNYGTTI